MMEGQLCSKLGEFHNSAKNLSAVDKLAFSRWMAAEIAELQKPRHRWKQV